MLETPASLAMTGVSGPSTLMWAARPFSTRLPLRDFPKIFNWMVDHFQSGIYIQPHG